MDQALNPYSPGAGIHPAVLVGRSTEHAAYITEESLCMGCAALEKQCSSMKLRVKLRLRTVRIEETSDKKNNKHVRTRLARELTRSARKISVRKRWKHILDILPVISAFSTTLGFTGISLNTAVSAL